MKTKAYYYNKDGKEVEKKEATHMRVATFDDNGKEINDVYSTVNGGTFPILEPILPS